MRVNLNCADTADAVLQFNQANLAGFLTLVVD